MESYSEKTKAVLLEEAKKRGLGVKSSNTKAEIIAALKASDKAAAPAKEEKPAEEKKAPVEKKAAPAAKPKRRVFNPMLHRFEYK